MLQALQAQFNRQLDELLTNLERQPLGKSVKTKDYITDLLNWDQMDEAMRAVLAPLVYNIIIEAGRDAMQFVDMTPSEFDSLSVAVRRYQSERSTKIAVDVNDETEKQLRAALTEGITANESTFELRARIENIMGNASTMRAERIARTEVARAQSFGDIEAWSQSGRVQGKEWYTALDERVCKWCGPMHGRVIELQQNFFDKGDVQYEDGTNRNGDARTFAYNHDYDDVAGAPLHPNCRCTLLPVRVR